MILPDHTNAQLSLVLHAINMELRYPEKVVVLVGADYADMITLNKLFVEITSTGYRRVSRMLFRHERNNRLRSTLYHFVCYTKQPVIM